MSHQEWYETVALEEQFLQEQKMLNAQEIIDTCHALARHYEHDDPMRWPFITGVLETKIRELVRICNHDEQVIRSLNAKIDEIFKEQE